MIAWLAVPSCSSETRRENRQQFITLAPYRIELLERQQVHLADEFQPRACFAKLLETDPEFVKKVAS